MRKRNCFALAAFICLAFSHAKASCQVVVAPTQQNFSVATNYMSRGGFNRWQTFNKTGVWWSGAPYVENGAMFYVDDSVAMGQAFFLATQAFKSNPYARSFSIYGDLEILGLEWDDHFPFGIEYRRDLRRLYVQVVNNKKTVYRVVEGEKTPLKYYREDN